MTRCWSMGWIVGPRVDRGIPGEMGVFFSFFQGGVDIRFAGGRQCLYGHFFVSDRYNR
jgi:hypothetical protein